jgi:hypothetical protein
MIETRIRAAAADDWPAALRSTHPITAAGKTFACRREPAEEHARARRCHEPPGRTLMAVDEQGKVVGTAESERWHPFGFDVLAIVPEAFDQPARSALGIHMMYRGL